MAVPDYENGILKLGFEFAFHQKKIDETKNRQIIMDIIRQHSGQQLEIITLLTPSKTTSSQKPAKPAINDLKSISNIFGGAEVLDS
jgi:hypothetical protein